MKRFVFVALLSAFAMGAGLASASAASCDTMAMGKDGKALAGAAKSSFVKKCKADACTSKAIDKNGKPLAGAAKASFLKKCEDEA